MFVTVHQEKKDNSSYLFCFYYILFTMSPVFCIIPVVFVEEKKFKNEPGIDISCMADMFRFML